MSQLDFTLFLVHFLNMVFTFYLFIYIMIFIMVEKSINDLFSKKNMKE